MISLLIATLAYSASLTLAAFASRAADPTLVAAVTNSIAALVPIALIAPVIGKLSFQDQRMGIIAAVLGGLLIAVFVIFLNKAFTENKVAVVSPIILGGSIFLSAILSYFFFKEKISTVQGLGLAFLAVGLVIIVYSKLTGK